MIQSTSSTREHTGRGIHFQQICVGGFGTLSQCQITGLTNGLNVIYGVNGSGKTTLLHFISGVLGGFEQAHRLRLLPPLKQGSPGGSLRVQNEQGRFDIVRYARADHSDTLAISLKQGSAEDLSDLRRLLQQEPRSFLPQLYAVTGSAAHDLASLVQFALDHEIPMASRTNSGAWISERVRIMESERAELFQTSPTQGALVALEQKREQIAARLAETIRSQQDQLATWQHSLQTLRDQIEHLKAMRDWQDQELQAVQCDLTEVQDRLWSTRQEIIQETETIQRPVAAPPAEWMTLLAGIDEEIAHAQQVLRDLAGNRMTVSVSKADLAGSEVPEIETVLQRQRQALSLIEAQTTQLTALLNGMADSTHCLCGPRSAQLQSGVNAIREQVWLICQELGRQQSSHRQELLQNQREGIDRCEHELIRQVQRLRIRRDEILHQQRQTADRIHFRTLHEAEGCQCSGHHEAIADWTAPTGEVTTTPELVIRERVLVTSNARANDPALERTLLNRLRELRHQIATTSEDLRLAWLKQQQLDQGSRELAGDRAVQNLRNEYALVEQQLSDAREQWQSLALLQAVLLRTQQKLNAEAVSPVIAEASQLLERMTEGRYPRFRWNRDTRELLVINEANGELPAQALSRGTLEQAVLCFRLALCREFQERGHHWPLILDDILTDSDERRSQAAADVLMDFAQTHQVLFLTCQEHLVELFAARQAPIFNLPGSSRQVTTTLHTTPAPLQKPVETTPAQQTTLESQTQACPERVQPDVPHWLQTGSPIAHVPSIGEQMARRLGALGVRTAGELVELDPETVHMPLESLQISASTLRKWQAEARLLCCVPNLTGRDAQLLVICGVYSPSELAECDVSTLLRRVADIRERHAGDYETQWLTQRPDWPSQSQVEQWIRSGRQARTWQAARDWSAQRQTHLGSHLSRQRRRHAAASAPMIHSARVRLHSQSLPESEETSWKFYLHQESPVVDAPSIGPRMAQRLGAIGIKFVSQLLDQIPADIAHRLNRRDVTVEVVRAWQQQANLMCLVPQLRGHDAQVLVSCRVTDPEMLASMTPARLFALVEPFVTSKEGARLLRSARVPDLEEVSDWIRCARQSPLLRAA